MSAEYICDGCGERAQAIDGRKPPHWFERSDKDGVQHACSRPCIEVVAAKTNKTSLVLPL